jgi:LAO/AO transport system kinase
LKVGTGLVSSVLEGDRLALARLLTQIENDTPEGRTALNELFSHTGGAHLIGVTGAPGTGKSTLVNKLTRYFRDLNNSVADHRVGIIAVDPSSPFSGGAILGDRVRMRDLAGDPNVFIRSMASRGSLGGLAAGTAGMVQALDAAGYDTILIETVGAGQAEVDIARLAHTTVVVEAPGLGDDVQAIKAGILEIADILVINKADRPGVENTERALRGMLQLAYPSPQIYDSHHADSTYKQMEASSLDVDQNRWQTQILRTVATEGTGIREVGELIYRHRQHLQDSGEWKQREISRLRAELDALLQATLVSRWRGSISPVHYDDVFDKLVRRTISPRQAVQKLLNGIVF